MQAIDPGNTTTQVDDDAGAAEDIEITPEAIDVGTVTCGMAPANVPAIVIKNRGKKTTKYTVQAPEGSPFELKGALTGDLAPDSLVTIAVTAKPAVPGPNTTEITVSAGARLSQIKVTAVGEGGRLAISPSSANLGEVRRENGGTIDVALSNTGTKAVTLTKVDSTLADFSATWEGAPTTGLVIPPNETKPVTVKLSSGTNLQALSAVLMLTVDGAYCGVVPTLPVQGQRVNQDVTISPADFGRLACNSTPTLQRDVTITNYSANALTYTAALQNGATSQFSIVSGATGALAPGSTTPTVAAVKLSMKTIGTTLGPLNEVVDIAITGIPAPSGGARTAAATANVRGVVLTITPNNSTGFVNTETRNFTFANTGNEAYAYSAYFIRDSGTSNYAAWLASNFGSVAAGATRAATVTFNPTYCGNGTYAGTWTFENANGIAFCHPKPTLHVQGRVCQ